jgi:hypothetical protein
MKLTLAPGDGSDHGQSRYRSAPGVDSAYLNLAREGQNHLEVEVFARYECEPL